MMMTRKIELLVCDQQGNSLVEMAFVLPILLVMLFGVVDLSASYARKLELERAAQSGAEMVTAAGSAASAMNDALVASEIAGIAGVPVSGVIVTRTQQCATGALTGTQKLCPDGSGAAPYWTFVVQESYRPPFGFNMLTVAGKPALLRGTASVRSGS